MSPKPPRKRTAPDAQKVPAQQSPQSKKTQALSCSSACTKGSAQTALADDNNTLTPTNPNTRPRSWRLALRYSIPIAMGYIPAAIAFGVLMRAADFPFWWGLALSVLLYSGAAQFAVIPMLAQAAHPFSMWLNLSIINMRHIFYALPLLQSLPRKGLVRAYCLFGLTDESFSTLMTLSKTEQRRVFLPFIFFNQSSWVLGTVIGLLLGGELNELIPNLDFALTALFVILAYEQYHSHKQSWPIYLSLVAFALMHLLIADYALLLSICLCAVIILLRALAVHTNKHRAEGK